MDPAGQSARVVTTDCLSVRASVFAMLAGPLPNIKNGGGAGGLRPPTHLCGFQYG